MDVSSQTDACREEGIVPRVTILEAIGKSKHSRARPLSLNLSL